MDRLSSLKNAWFDFRDKETVKKIKDIVDVVLGLAFLIGLVATETVDDRAMIVQIRMATYGIFVLWGVFDFLIENSEDVAIELLLKLVALGLPLIFTAYDFEIKVAYASIHTAVNLQQLGFWLLALKAISFVLKLILRKIWALIMLVIHLFFDLINRNHNQPEQNQYDNTEQ